MSRNKKKYTLHFTFLFRPKKNKPEAVPVKFVAFLRAALAKMAGNHFLSPELIDMDFWSKMNLRFSSVKFYDKSLVIKGLISFKSTKTNHPCFGLFKILLTF